jgi:hypothetical protein
MSQIGFTVNKQEAKIIALALRLAARDHITRATKAYAAGSYQRSDHHRLAADQCDAIAEQVETLVIASMVGGRN